MEDDLFDIEPLGVDPEKLKAWDKRIEDELAARRYLPSTFRITINQLDLKIPFNEFDNNAITHAVVRSVNKFNPEFECTRALIINNTNPDACFICLYFDNHEHSWCATKEGGKVRGNSRAFTYKSDYFFPKFFNKDLIKNVKDKWEFTIRFCSLAKGEELQKLLRIK